MTESFSGNLNPTPGHARPDHESDPFASYDIGATPAPIQLPEGMTMGPMDPYEMLGATPPTELTLGHLALLNEATNIVYKGKNEKGEDELRQLSAHELERREGHINNFFTFEGAGKSTIRSDVPERLQQQLGAHRIKYGHTLAPMRRLQQPLAPFEQTAPTMPIGEELARDYIEELHHSHNVLEAHQKDLQDKKKGKVDNSGHTYTMTKQTGRPQRRSVYPPAKPPRPSRSFWNLLNRLEARVLKQAAVAQAKKDLKASRAGLKATYRANDELVDTGDRAVRNYLLQNDQRPDMEDPNKIQHIVPKSQRRTLIVRNREAAKGTINHVKDLPVERRPGRR